MTAARVSVAAALTALAALLAVCGPAYREPPPTDTRPRTQGGPIVVGTITAEGELIADTLSGEVADAERAERETVVTGAVARYPAGAEPGRTADLPAGATSDAAAGEPTAAPAEAPAPGPWVVQVFAAQEEAAAAMVARDAGNVSGSPARVDHEAGWYKVRVGGYADRAAAEALRTRLAARWSDAFVVRAGS